MIKKEDITAIGTFRKTHALLGELNAEFDIDAEFVDEDTPLILDVDGIWVPFYCDSIRPKGRHSSLVKLEGVDSEEQARPFVNKTIYAIRRAVSEFEEESFEEDAEGGYADDFIGYLLADTEAGVLGRIVDLDTRTQNALFILEREDGSELLVPVADELVESIDPETKTITMNLPEGITDQ